MADITEITRRALANVQPKPITKEIITAIAREKLAQQRGETGLTYAQTCAIALLEGAIAALQSENPNAGPMNALLDRIEGRVPQAVAHTGADGGPIQTEDVSAEQIYRRIAGIAERSAEGAAPGRANGHGGTTH